VALKRGLAAWKEVVARFLTRSGDELGADGDAYLGGASVAAALGDPRNPAAAPTAPTAAAEAAVPSAVAKQAGPAAPAEGSGDQDDAAALAAAEAAAVAAAAQAEREAERAARMAALAQGAASAVDASCGAAWAADEPEHQLLSLCAEMDALLGPVLGGAPLAAALDDLAMMNRQNGGDLVLLVDHQLLDLPLELLGPLRRRGLRPVARDFSAHVLCGRYAWADPAWDAASRSDPREGTGAAGTDPASGSELPNAAVAPNSKVVFVADPRKEDSGPPPAVLASAARAAKAEGAAVGASPQQLPPQPPPSSHARLSALELLRGPLSAASAGGPAGSWTGVGGDERICSAGEWQALLRGVDRATGGGFVFLGPGPVLAHLPPTKLAGLDARGCRLVVLVDRADTEGSSRRRAKEASSGARRPQDALLERPVETAALFTLAGCGSVVANQWQSSFHANNALALNVFEGLAGPRKLELGRALARATHAQGPAGHEEDDKARQAAAAAVAAASAAAQDDKKKGGGGDKAKAIGHKGGGDEDATAAAAAEAAALAVEAAAFALPDRSAKARAMYNPVLYGLPTVELGGGAGKVKGGGGVGAPPPAKPAAKGKKK